MELRVGFFKVAHFEMERERISTVDSGQSYAFPAISGLMNIDTFPDSLAGSGKSILWYAAFPLFL